MRPFRITRISEPDNSAWRLYRTRETIQTDPEYQRSSDIWTEEKKQLLIDTILNGFDVPKLYFHKFQTPITVQGKEYEFAIIDGKQRLEAIWEFIGGKFALSMDFECLWDTTLAAAGMTYSELGKNHPDLRNAIDSYGLTVVCIETDDLEIIEDMFSRLNEAVPLSAAEKRNAKGGPVPGAIKALTASRFFWSKVPFGNSRYRHFDLAAKFLMSTEKTKVFDTKKRTLDRYVTDWAAKSGRDQVLPFFDTALSITEDMAKVFTDKDRLLRQVGAVTLYFHLFRLARAEGWTAEIERHKLEVFEGERARNRTVVEAGGSGFAELIEFDRYAQSSNDAYAVKIRLRTLLKSVFDRDVPVEAL
jgi:Protein of unknown function DUF262